MPSNRKRTSLCAPTDSRFAAVASPELQPSSLLTSCPQTGIDHLATMAICSSHQTAWGKPASTGEHGKGCNSPGLPPSTSSDVKRRGSRWPGNLLLSTTEPGQTGGYTSNHNIPTIFWGIRCTLCWSSALGGSTGRAVRSPFQRSRFQALASGPGWDSPPLETWTRARIVDSTDPMHHFYPKLGSARRVHCRPAGVN